MLSDMYSGSSNPGVTVALRDFSSLMNNCSAEKDQELFGDKIQHKKHKNSSTVL